MATVRVRKRGKTYSYIFEAGKTTDGKRRVIEKGGFALKDDAYAAGVTAYTDYRHGNIGITSDRITLRAFCQKWMENVVRSNVRASTYDVYSRILEHHILSVIGITLPWPRRRPNCKQEEDAPNKTPLAHIIRNRLRKANPHFHSEVLRKWLLDTPSDIYKYGNAICLSHAREHHRKRSRQR